MYKLIYTALHCGEKQRSWKPSCVAALAGYMGPRQPTSLSADVSVASKWRSPGRCFPTSAGILVPAGQPQGGCEVRVRGPKAGSLHWGSCARHLEPRQGSVTATNDNTGAEGDTGASASSAAGVRRPLVRAGWLRGAGGRRSAPRPRAAQRRPRPWSGCGRRRRRWTSTRSTAGGRPGGAAAEPGC